MITSQWQPLQFHNTCTFKHTQTYLKRGICKLMQNSCKNCEIYCTEHTLTPIVHCEHLYNRRAGSSGVTLSVVEEAGIVEDKTKPLSGLLLPTFHILTVSTMEAQQRASS